MPHVEVSATTLADMAHMEELLVSGHQAEMIVLPSVVFMPLAATRRPFFVLRSYMKMQA